MRVKFKIDYRTSWGQFIAISGAGEQLGDWDINKAVYLQPDSLSSWAGEIELNADEELEYKFVLIDPQHNYHSFEFGDPRKLLVEVANDNVLVKAYWREPLELSNSLYTSSFVDAYFKRTVGKKKGKVFKKSIGFQLRASRIEPEYCFAVVGGIPELGSWDGKKALILEDSDYPAWNSTINASKIKKAFEYKYVIYDPAKKEIVAWEAGDNRSYTPEKGFSSQVICDENFQFPSGNWRGAGVAIPVFSLRSKQGIGVGEFPDIKALVDWSVETDMKLVQILPVNDTVATKTWTDSYPYASISVYALHPIYGNVQALGKLKDKTLQKEINAEQMRLNQLPEVDYEAVMAIKTKAYKAFFEQDGDELLKSKSFKSFIEENKDWLEPYAVFCALRDKYETVDFSQWKDESAYSDALLKKLTKKSSKLWKEIALHYFIQYHLDLQLKEAADYARANGVVLKGDIPIGIYRYSVDAWVAPELYNMNGQAGAPPDDFSVNGQNWGFPTYNWEEMFKDGLKWWKDRLIVLSKYFDVFRIDHILGFFRIWEIPLQYVDGIMGHFNPALPISINELREKGIEFDYDRFCKPYIKHHVVRNLFGSHAELVFDEYLIDEGYGSFRFKPEFDTQKKLYKYFKEQEKDSDFDRWLLSNLMRLYTEVVMLDSDEYEKFHPRIAMHSTFSFQDLDDGTKGVLDELYDHYYYHRHNDFWRDMAMRKLPILKDATNMLICGEDLGMVPASVPGVMHDLSLLSLAIQRMPGDDREFWHPADTPYLSVTTTGSHDMSTLREWWQEDGDKTQRFFNHILGREGKAPFYCEPDLAEAVIWQHLHSPSMWAIFPLQDFLAMDSGLRRQNPEEERINVPANPKHYWRYRMHMDIEDLLKSRDFNKKLAFMVKESSRKNNI